MSSIVAPGKDFTLTFHHWRDLLFSRYNRITGNERGVFIPFVMDLIFKLMFMVPLSYGTIWYLWSLNTVWYCWQSSFSWWSNLALLISSCSDCWAQVINCFFPLIIDVVTNSITILEMLNILFCGSVRSCCC